MDNPMRMSPVPRARAFRVPALMSLAVALLCPWGMGRAFGEEGPAAPAVPLTAFDLQVTHSTQTSLKQDGAGVGRQSVAGEQATFLKRLQIGTGGWYLGWGAQGESFSFGGSNRAGIPDLHDVAGILSLEYFVGGNAAASLSVKPGFYFSDTVRADSLDAPLQLVSGFPLGKSLNGVIGVSAARFYKNPIPIAGLSWTINSSCRLEAVFPEPALVVSAGRGVEFKFGGELQSGGFRTGTGEAVEYYSYDLKGRVSCLVRPHVTVSAAVGVELERSFDFLSSGRRYKSEGALLGQIGVGFAF